MRTFKRLICIMLTISMITALGACSKKNDSDNSAQDANNSTTITITDQADNKVTLPKEINRIVVCDIVPLPSVLSVFFDSAQKIVGMTDTSMSAAKNSLLSELYPEILNANTSFMKGSEVNIEELMSLNPDVVFYSSASAELGEQLRNAGLAAVAISVNKWEYNTIETLNNWIALLSEIFPDNDKTKIVEGYSNDVYDMIQERVKDIKTADRARVFFLFKYTDSSIMTSGKLFFGNWWATAIGAVNVAEELSTDNSVEVNMEQVYSWNPDIVLITNFTAAQPDDLYNNSIGNSDWSRISAIENKKVYKMPLGMYRSYTPGVDTPITLMWLAKTVYPDLFTDIDITTETKKYYNDVFGITLTDKQAESIFTPVSAAADGFDKK